MYRRQIIVIFFIKIFWPQGRRLREFNGTRTRQTRDRGYDHGTRWGAISLRGAMRGKGIKEEEIPHRPHHPTWLFRERQPAVYLLRIR